ncbi:GMC oxidoreductase [Diaporthe helianthi]|uniref:GMC oxidoreductase n=1 Tax=Diaporthe helianthi TaxID=158607 RepID=A0A2P5HH65_DIAHE|nr:GMC oxidoreductase [Diaporthe helianthi]
MAFAFSIRCLLLGVIRLAVAVIIRDPSTVNRTYDYIVAGGGLTGLVVANRLTEDPNTSVLVVEYGDFDDRWDVAIPYHARFLHTEDLFEIPSEPQKGLWNRSFSVWLRKTVGGGSTVNGMALSRGARADYDAWEALGNPGWGWEGMFPYFKRSSSLTYPGPELVHKYGYVVSPEGYGRGPMQAGFPKWQFPALNNYIDAWTKDIGVEYRTDGDTNGENIGMAWKPIDIDPVNITRSSARKAYYDPASGRANLDILVGCYVATLDTDPSASVTGVNVRVARVNSSSTKQIFLRSGKEVILAAGAVHTTKILQLSGIGPAALLQPLGIGIVVDLPGVGANFQDHPTNNGYSFKFLNEPSLNPNLYDEASFYNESWDEYMANRTGPLTWAFGNNRVVLSLNNLTNDYQALMDDFLHGNETSQYLDDWHKQHPVLEAGYKLQHQIMAQVISEKHGSVMESVFGGAAGSPFTVVKPFSRGTVLINSTNPDPILGAPQVNYQALTHPFDMKLAIEGLKMVRKLLSTPSMALLHPVEIVPGANVTTEAQIEEAIRTILYRPSNSHPCCTAAMLPLELGGVVDPQLRVYGVQGLRIVDASILPLIPSAHTQETMYAVGEKAADVIKGVNGYR